MNERDTGAPSSEIAKSFESIEQKREQVDKWIKNISEEQKVGDEVDQKLLREVLISYGAHFENVNDEGRESLKGYSENERGLGVKQVWGEEKVKNYKSWIKGYIALYDESHETAQLPVLGEKEGLPYPESGRKNSGMIQFLYELTSFASGETNFDDFKTYMEARVNNGVAWAEGRKKDRVRVKVPTAAEPILLGSIPKEFPVAAMDWIKTRASESLPQQ